MSSSIAPLPTHLKSNRTVRRVGVGLLCAAVQLTCAHAAGLQAPPGQRDDTSARRPNTGNRIEITGNTVNGVRCANGASTSINSVNVDAASLKGRTVIIQGKNEGGSSIDCPEQPTAGQTGTTQINNINSVNIR